MLDLHSSESDSERYDNVKAGVEDVLPGRDDEIAPFLATMLGIKLEGDPRERVRYLEPPMLRGRIFQAVASFVAARAAREPLLLLFEDLHWVDSTSLELLESLLPLTESVPLLLLAIFRPNKQDPSWRFHEIGMRDHTDRYTPVSLQPLDESESRQLVANLLEIEDLPEKVRALILRKAEGNPFFVEEVIRSLLDAKLVVREDSRWRATREIENIAVPDTLAGVITARLDRLDDESKYVAQAAAVVGREFQHDVLSEVYEMPDALDPALANLQQRELVREKSRLPRRAYLFKHVLTQETAYASMLLSRRREIHRRVAECLERLEPDRVNDIARHYLEARQEAFALPYLIQAADRAAGAGARDEAIGQYQRAVEVARSLDDHGQLRKAYEGLGKALEFAMRPPEAIDAYKTMLAFAEEHADIGMQVSALNKMAYTYAFVLGQIVEADQCLAQAEELARKHEQFAGLAEATTVRCGICTFIADFETAAKHLAEATHLGRVIEDPDTMAFGLAHGATMLAHLARFEEAYEKAQEGLIVAEEARNLERRADLLSYPIPYYHLHRGDLAEAYRCAEEGYNIGARIGAPIPPIFAAYMLGTISEMQGNYELALEWHRRGLEIARPLMDYMPFMLVIALGGIGAICLDISEELKDKVVEYHSEALHLLGIPMGMPGGGTGWADLGFCAFALGYPDKAYEHFQNGLTIPSMQMYLQRPRLLAGAALAAQALGKTEEAIEHIQEAHRYSEEGGFMWFYPLISLIDGRVSAARDDSERALDRYKHAMELAQQMGMHHITWQAQLGAAQLLRDCGNTAEAAALQASARQTLKDLIANFKDDAYREAFAQSVA
ncbi:MAG: AAA family ATPase, partial [Chloroflexia bacterium]